MARATLAAHIAAVRFLIAETASEMSDDHIAFHLDANRVALRSCLLEAKTNPAGTIRMWVAPSGWIEEDATFALRDRNGNNVAYSTADFKLGYFTVDDPDLRYLYLDGWIYDLHAAAADAVDAQAAAEKRNFSYSNPRDSYQRQQIFSQMNDLADRLRRRAWLIRPQ